MLIISPDISKKKENSHPKPFAINTNKENSHPNLLQGIGLIHNDLPITYQVLVLGGQKGIYLSKKKAESLKISESM
jgi:hypothetical protein